MSSPKKLATLSTCQSFVKKAPIPYPHQHLPNCDQTNTIVTEHKNGLETELNHLKTKLCQAESEKATLITAHEDEIIKSKNRKFQLSEATHALNHLKDSHVILDYLGNSKKRLEKKHGHVCHEL